MVAGYCELVPEQNGGKRQNEGLEGERRGVEQRRIGRRIRKNFHQVSKLI